jgi:hypothetical protein
VGKQHVRLYPIDVERMPWQEADGVRGVWEKVLTRDESTGSVTRYLRLDPDAELPERRHDVWEETYVLDGSYKSGEEFYPAGTYVCRPPGTEEGQILTAEGALCIQMRDVSDTLDKPAVRLYPIDIERMPWEPTPFGNPKHHQKTLAIGPSGSLTRLLLIDPGGDTVELDDHEHDEEVLLVRGGCKNGDEWHPEGTYTFNPPHTQHGPFLVDEPLLCFEVKNNPA